MTHFNSTIVLNLLFYYLCFYLFFSLFSLLISFLFFFFFIYWAVCRSIFAASSRPHSPLRFVLRSSLFLHYGIHCIVDLWSTSPFLVSSSSRCTKQVISLRSSLLSRENRSAPLRFACIDSRGSHHSRDRYKYWRWCIHTYTHTCIHTHTHTHTHTRARAFLVVWSFAYSRKAFRYLVNPSRTKRFITY